MRDGGGEESHLRIASKTAVCCFLFVWRNPCCLVFFEWTKFPFTDTSKFLRARLRCSGVHFFVFFGERGFTLTLWCLGLFAKRPGHWDTSF